MFSCIALNIAMRWVMVAPVSLLLALTIALEASDIDPSSDLIYFGQLERLASELNGNDACSLLGSGTGSLGKKVLTDANYKLVGLQASSLVCTNNPMNP